MSFISFRAKYNYILMMFFPYMGTLIILFSEMLKFSQIIHKKISKENKEYDEIFKNISFVKMESSQLINELFNKNVLKWPR
jgi:uncharacterized membrane protein